MPRPRPGAPLAQPAIGVGQFAGNNRPGAPEHAASSDWLDGMLGAGDGGSRVAMMITSSRRYLGGALTPQQFLAPVPHNDTSDSLRVQGNTSSALNRRAGAR